MAVSAKAASHLEAEVTEATDAINLLSDQEGHMRGLSSNPVTSGGGESESGGIGDVGKHSGSG